MGGVYANFANVSHSDYEFTITFARVDHEVEDEEIPGVVVSRINLSPKFMRELIDAMQDNYSKWQTREGIKNLPEYGGGEHARGSRTGGSEGPPAARSAFGRSSALTSARRSAQRSAGGWRAARSPSRGGSRSATFCSAIARSNDTNASGAPASSQRELVRPALDRTRHAVRDQAERRATSAAASASAGSATALARSADSAQLTRCTASAAAGATIARIQHPARHVAVADVRQLVRDHEPDLIAAVAVEQRVEQDHALGRAEPGDVSVGGRRAPARIDRIDLPDPARPAATRQLQHVGAGLPFGQRREIVEDRVQDDRRKRAEHGPDRDRAAGGRQPPVAGVAPHRPRRPRPAPPAIRAASIPVALTRVDAPVPPGLGHQPNPERASAGDRRQRQGGSDRATASPAPPGRSARHRSASTAALRQAGRRRTSERRAPPARPPPEPARARAAAARTAGRGRSPRR